MNDQQPKSRRSQVAIYIPDDLLDAIDAEVARLGTKRSAWIVEQCERAIRERQSKPTPPPNDNSVTIAARFRPIPGRA